MKILNEMFFDKINDSARRDADATITVLNSKRWETVCSIWLGRLGTLTVMAGDDGYYAQIYLDDALKGCENVAIGESALETLTKAAEQFQLAEARIRKSVELFECAGPHRDKEPKLTKGQKVARMNTSTFLAKCPDGGESFRTIARRLIAWTMSKDAPEKLMISAGSATTAIGLLIQAGKLQARDGLYFRGPNA